VRLWGPLRVAILLGAVVCAQPARAGVVVFSSDRCPESRQASCLPSIWSVSDDGSGLRRLTLGFDSMPEPSSIDEEPSWSPAGDSILYSRNFGDRKSLWIMRSDGSGKRQVGPDATTGGYLQPDWSPDGLRIAFASANSIWVMRSDGSAIRQLTRGEFDSAPTFSPDGRRVVFARASATSTWQLGLMAVGLDGSHPAPVVVGHVPEQDMFGPLIRPSPARIAYSPDGRSLAFTIFKSVYTVRLDTGAFQRHSTEPDSPGDVAWAAAPGQTLIYADAPGGNNPLRRIDLDGAARGPRPFTPPFPQPYDYISGERAPDWLPIPAIAALPDVLPPVPVLLGGKTIRVRSATRRSKRTTVIRGRRAELNPLVADPSGVRRFAVSVARRTRGKCRFLGRLRFGRQRSCAQPVYRRVGSQAAWKRLLRRLPTGTTYQFRLSARDGAGNRRRRPRAVTVQLTK
jgi:hypothetical protein